MLARQHFYYSTIRRYTVVFGSLFKDIQIKRVRPDTTVDTINVPIKYAGGTVREKITKGRERDKKRIKQALPSMTFELTDLEYDSMRKTNNAQKMVNNRITIDDGRKYQYNRVPYNFMYDLTLKAKNMDDMLQMVEQIIPYFDPSLVVSVEETSETGIVSTQNIMVQLTANAKNDTYEGDFEETRILDWTMSFILEGYLYKQTYEGVIVKYVDTRFINKNEEVILNRVDTGTDPNQDTDTISLLSTDTIDTDIFQSDVTLT